MAIICIWINFSFNHKKTHRYTCSDGKKMWKKVTILSCYKQKAGSEEENWVLFDVEPSWSCLLFQGGLKPNQVTLKVGLASKASSVDPTWLASSLNRTFYGINFRIKLLKTCVCLTLLLSGPRVWLWCSSSHCSLFQCTKHVHNDIFRPGTLIRFHCGAFLPLTSTTRNIVSYQEQLYLELSQWRRTTSMSVHACSSMLHSHPLKSEEKESYAFPKRTAMKADDL